MKQFISDTLDIISEVKNMKKETQLYLEALEALQEIKVEELDALIGGGGRASNTISSDCRWNSLQIIFSCC